MEASQAASEERAASEESVVEYSVVEGSVEMAEAAKPAWIQIQASQGSAGIAVAAEAKEAEETDVEEEGLAVGGLVVPVAMAGRVEAEDTGS